MCINWIDLREVVFVLLEFPPNEESSSPDLRCHKSNNFPAPYGAFSHGKSNYHSLLRNLFLYKIKYLILEINELNAYIVDELDRWGRQQNIVKLLWRCTLVTSFRNVSLILCPDCTDTDFIIPIIIVCIIWT